MDNWPRVMLERASRRLSPAAGLFELALSVLAATACLFLVGVFFIGAGDVLRLLTHGDVPRDRVGAAAVLIATALASTMVGDFGRQTETIKRQVVSRGGDWPAVTPLSRTVELWIGVGFAILAIVSGPEPFSLWSMRWLGVTAMPRAGLAALAAFLIVARVVGASQRLSEAKWRLRVLPAGA